MIVDLKLLDNSNGNQSINEGRFSKIFDVKGTGDERYQSFLVNIAAQQHMNHTSWWRIDVSTDSKNIDIRTLKEPYGGWLLGHSFHSMTIQIARDIGNWYDVGCWEQIRYATTESSSTLSTIKSTKIVPASTEII